MRILIAPLAAMLLGGGVALAAEPDLSSPFDKNPRCTERTVDSNSPECVIQSEGDPRQTYPSKAKPTPPTTPVPPTPPSQPVSPPQAARPGASK